MARILLVTALVLVFGPAVAHISEGALVLLLPTDLFATFGVAAVILTVVLTVFVPASVVKRLYLDAPLLADNRDVAHGFHVVGFLIYAGLVALGYWGPHDPLTNLLPLTVFTVWWICFLILQAIAGDLWHWLNPWLGPVNWVFRGRKTAKMPGWLAEWPALAGFLLFGLYYLSDLAPDDPSRLANFAAGYWLFTFAMCGVYGAEWLRRGEFFTVLFSLVARLAIISWRPFAMHMPGRGVFQNPHFSVSLAVLSVSFLAVGSFDGLNETFWWMAQIGINPLAFPGRSAVIGPNILGLLGAVVLLNATFALSVWLGWLAAGKRVAFVSLYCRLALTMLPIAVGYHLAHYLTSIMVALQYWIAALNDPLGQGANLLGLAEFHVTTGFFNQHDTVLKIWLTQAGAIVLGHMVAVVLAHAVALDVFGKHWLAVKSQIFMVILMVSYTGFGLWLLASPTAT